MREASTTLILLAVLLGTTACGTARSNSFSAVSGQDQPTRDSDALKSKSTETLIGEYKAARLAGEDETAKEIETELRERASTDTEMLAEILDRLDRIEAMLQKMEGSGSEDEESPGEEDDDSGNEDEESEGSGEKDDGGTASEEADGKEQGKDEVKSEGNTGDEEGDGCEDGGVDSTEDGADETSGAAEEGDSEHESDGSCCEDED